MSLQRSTFKPRLATAIGAAIISLALAAGCASSPVAATEQTSSSAAPSSTSATAAATTATSTSASTAATSGSRSTAAAAAFPVTVTGDNGAVTIPDRPVSIASLSASATEMLYAIGAGDQVTVVDKYSDYPATGLPDARVDAYQLNVEALTAYQPDLVITSGASPDQQAAFDKLGMPMLVEGAPADPAGAFAQIETLGKATGHEAEASALVAKLQSQVADITSHAPAEGQPLTYYYELDPTYYSVTSDTFVGRILGDLGLKSIADEAEGAAAAGGYPQLSAEYILKADPDYIFLADTACCEQSASSVAARDGWSTLSAVAGGRVVELNDSIASRWGPRIVDLMQTVADALKAHPVTR